MPDGTFLSDAARCRHVAGLTVAVFLTGSVHCSAREPSLFVQGSWTAILKAQAGRPTIVDFWGIGCGSCKIELEAWGRLLARRHDFDFVTVNTGIVGSPRQANALLAASGVSTDTAWRFANGFDEGLYRQVDPAWTYEIPMTVLIDRDGRCTRLVDVGDFKRVEAWLDQQRGP